MSNFKLFRAIPVEIYNKLVGSTSEPQPEIVVDIANLLPQKQRARGEQITQVEQLFSKEMSPI